VISISYPLFDWQKAIAGITNSRIAAKNFPIYQSELVENNKNSYCNFSAKVCTGKY
jgi:hypothetical protein